MADHSQKWQDGTSTRNKSSNASDGLAVIQAQLNNLCKEIKKVNERVKVLQERGYGSLSSLTEINPRDHVNSITTTEEAETFKEDDKMPLIELSRATILFPGCWKENGYDEKELLKELKKLQVNSTESATNLRRLLKEKSMINEEIKATMNVHCSSILKDALPLKEKDSWSFTLPCNINNMCFDKALADLGASVSVMPYSTIKFLNCLIKL
nr:hypothetical protein [Tanacetum cinerariifolium]